MIFEFLFAITVIFVISQCQKMSFLRLILNRLLSRQKNKSRFICAICSKILKDPCSLACVQCNVKQTVCKEHFIQNKIKCNKCDHKCFKQTQITLDDMSNVIERQISQDEHLTEYESQSKSLMNSYIDTMLTYSNQLDVKTNEFNLKQYEHFFNLKNEIDINRETMIQEIYGSETSNALIDELQKSSENLIQQIEKKNEEFSFKFSQLILGPLRNFKININDERQMFEEFYRNPNLTHHDLNTYELNLKTKLNKLQSLYMMCALMEELLLKNVYVTKEKEMGTLSLTNLKCLPPDHPIENCFVFNTHLGLIQIFNLNCGISIDRITEYFSGRVKCMAVYEGKIS